MIVNIKKIKGPKVIIMQQEQKALDILKPLFWDYQWTSVLERIDSPFVIARVLELGNPPQVRALINRVGEEKIIGFLQRKGEKLLSARSFNFWTLYYDETLTTTQESR